MTPVLPQQILMFLRKHPERGYTNADIAMNLRNPYRPEASVRRATLQLEKQGLLRVVTHWPWPWRHIPLKWGLA